MHALDAREAVADLVGDLTGLLLDRLALSLLSPGFLCIALAIGFFLARNPGEVACAQDRLGTLSPHQAPPPDAPEDLSVTSSRTRTLAAGNRGSSSRSPMPDPTRV
jgi:hypothetical protein